jgi:hypothetical protein
MYLKGGKIRMSVNKTKRIKVINNMPAGGLGIVLSDGKRKTLRQPDTFTTVSAEDIWHIFNSCKTIQKGHLYIDDTAMRVELGLEEDDSVDINALSREELRAIISESDVVELKEILDSDVSNGTKEKLVVLAREEYKKNGMDAKKLKLLERETGLPVAEEDGSDIKEVNDVKEKKKVKKPGRPSKTNK